MKKRKFSHAGNSVLYLGVSVMVLLFAIICCNIINSHVARYIEYWPLNPDNENISWLITANFEKRTYRCDFDDNLLQNGIVYAFKDGHKYLMHQECPCAPISHEKDPDYDANQKLLALPDGK